MSFSAKNFRQVYRRRGRRNRKGRNLTNPIAFGLTPAPPKTENAEKKKQAETFREWEKERKIRMMERMMSWQPGPKVSQVGDAKEVEAETMADKVMGNEHFKSAQEENERLSESGSFLQNKDESIHRAEDEQVAKAEDEQVAKAEDEQVAKAEDEQVAKAEDEQVAKAEDEQVAKAEDEQVAKAEDEQVAKAEDEQVAKAEDEQVAKAEDEQVAKAEDEQVATKKMGGKGAKRASKGFKNKLDQKAGTGTPLPAPLRAFMERKMGADFSGVRIHNDAQSMQMNKDIHAHAFTFKKDIFFNAGKYNPDSYEGKKLLAHELTHVMQQDSNAREKKVDRKA